MKNALKYLAMFFILAAAATQCKKDEEPCCDPTNPECPNYDPCWGKEPSADFKMRQTYPGFVLPEDLQGEWCDTIFGSGVEFRADIDGALSYTWQVGTESTTRSGRNIVVNFSSYTQDTIQNLNPDNPDYYLPLDVVLSVRNVSGPCVAESDTVLTRTRQLVFARKSLTGGTFRGRVDGESFDRDVKLWRDAGDFSNPDFTFWYVSEHIGLPATDTLVIFHVMSPTLSNEELVSYKQWRWEQDWENYALARDGIRSWKQEITTSTSGPDRIDLYFERIPEDNSGVQIVRFSGKRIE